MSAAPTGQPVLVDTGPLVAWFDRSDADHQRCRRFFSQASGPLISTWPVVTEVCHLVPTALAPRFLEWIQLGGLQLAEIPAAHTAASAGRCHGQLQQPRAWLAHGIGKAARARLVDLVPKTVPIWRLLGGGHRRRYGWLIWLLGHLVMRRVALAQAKAQLSALLDAVEAGEEVVITRRGLPVARVVREPSRPADGHDWPARLRSLHGDQPAPVGSAVALLRELREQEP